MLSEALKKEELPDGAKILSVEGHNDGDHFFRGVLFDVDGDTHAASVMDIVEANSVIEVVDILTRLYKDSASWWLPVEDGELIRYLQPDCLSLAEAAEAAIGIPPFRSDPLPLCPHCGQTIKEWIE